MKLKALSAAMTTVMTDLGYFNLDMAKIAVKLSQDAYCGWRQYETHAYVGAASGFKWTRTIHNVE
jgi:hypothetical protein